MQGRRLNTNIIVFKTKSNINSHYSIKAAEDMGNVLEKFVAAFIDFGPGLLVASVHGPATGISVTTLPLCDAAYASDSSRFTTPFTRLSQVYLFHGMELSKLYKNYIPLNNMKNVTEFCSYYYLFVGTRRMLNLHISS